MAAYNPVTGQGGAPAGSGRKLNFLGWAVVLLGLYAFNGTTTGHRVMYYAMVLIVLFLFISNYSRIMGVISNPAQ